MTLIEQLKRDRDNLEIEYNAKRTMLDGIIHRAETLTITSDTSQTRQVTMAGPLIGSVIDDRPRVGRPRKVRVVSNEPTPNAPAPKAKKFAQPTRRTGEGTVAAAVRELLPTFDGREFLGAEVGEAVKARYPDLCEHPEFPTKIAGALFALREKNEIELTRREGARPVYRVLKLREDSRSMFNAIHAEVEAKLAAKRAAEEG